MAVDGDFRGADPVLVRMPPDVRQRFANRQFAIACILFRRPPDASRRVAPGACERTAAAPCLPPYDPPPIGGGRQDALLECSTEETPEAIVIHPMGELDHETVAILRVPLTAGVESDRNVVIDMAGVLHIDSLGIHELLVHRRLCRARGRCLVLVAPRGPVQRVISIVDLGKVIPVFPSLELALGSIRAGTPC